MNFEVKISKKPIEYKKSMKILEKRVYDVSAGTKSDFLWILEHKSIYTGGIRSENSDIVDKKIKIIKTNRGGKYTYHGPGQKIVYFVLNLNNREKDIRKLINKIESCIINILKEFNIKSYADRKNIGIWVGKKKNSKKIAAIGIKVKKWVAYHGFSLNISTDLSKYDAIIPCGIKNKGVTSLKKIGVSKVEKIDTVIVDNFLNTFR